MDRGAAQRAGAGPERVGDALGQRRQGPGAQCGGGRRARSVFLFALKRIVFEVSIVFDDIANVFKLVSLNFNFPSAVVVYCTACAFSMDIVIDKNAVRVSFIFIKIIL
jgi:hypothetical protein